jgi:hypothetical protein
MARQALASGDEVGLLVLLDSRPPGPNGYTRHTLQYISSRARRWANDIRAPLDDGLGVGGGIRGRGQRVKSQLRRWLDDRLPHDANEAPPTIERSRIEYQRNAPGLPGPTLQGAHGAHPEQSIRGEDIGLEWESLVPVGIDIRQAPGDYHSYIRDHVQEPAGILAAALQQARSSAPR